MSESVWEGYYREWATCDTNNYDEFWQNVKGYCPEIKESEKEEVKNEITIMDTFVPTWKTYDPDKDEVPF